MRILDYFGIQGDQREHLLAITRDAQENGWWERYDDEMGPRQALYANLEAGAVGIAEYQMVLLPGLLQTPAFAEARASANPSIYPARFAVEHAVQARAYRQRILERPSPPMYEVIIDELAIRRPSADPGIVQAQLDHLINVGHGRPHVAIRVLPLTAHIAGYAVPRSSFYCYRYADPGDPVVVAVDTATSDLILERPGEVQPYLDLYQRLREAALAPR